MRYRTAVAVLAAAFAAGTPALGAMRPADVVTFAGSFLTTCAMPNDGQGPKSGDYTCQHTATATGCTALAGAAAGAGCRADMVRGATRGTATNIDGLSLWTCDSGAGAGTFVYQRDAGGPPLRIPVALELVGRTLVVSGSYAEPRTGRAIVVRARFPASCAWVTEVPGYDGSITPV